MGGMHPISQTDIRHYAENHRIMWQSWEVTALRRMSQAYCSMSAEARSPTCPPPYIGEAAMTQDKRAKVDGFFKKLASQGRKKGRNLRKLQNG